MSGSRHRQEVYLGIVAEGVLQISREELRSLGTTFPKPVSITVLYPHLKTYERVLLEGAEAALKTTPRSQRQRRLRSRRIRRSMLKRNHKRNMALFRDALNKLVHTGPVQIGDEDRPTIPSPEIPPEMKNSPDPIGFLYVPEDD